MLRGSGAEIPGPQAFDSIFSMETVEVAAKAPVDMFGQALAKCVPFPIDLAHLAPSTIKDAKLPPLASESSLP